MARKPIASKRAAALGTDPAYLTPKQRAKVFDEGTFTATETGAKKAAMLKGIRQGTMR